jgi:prevent-host-death family protein
MKTQHKNSTIIGVKELRQNLEKYISKIDKGQVFTVVRRSKPVFKISPADEWGDDGVWETVIDFREIDKDGVPATDVLKALKKIDG